MTVQARSLLILAVLLVMYGLLRPYCHLLIVVLISAKHLNAGKPLSDRIDQISPDGVRVCAVQGTNGNGPETDDVPGILQALKTCNNGGRVVLAGNYALAQPLHVTDLLNIEVEINGYLQFDNTLEYWQKNALFVSEQANLSYSAIGGRNVTIFGTGTIDGNGQRFYDAFGSRPDSLVRPHLLAFKDLHDSQLSGLKLVNSPQWFIAMKDSSNVHIEGLSIRAENGTGTGKAAANTDGINFHRSSNMVFRSSTIVNGDDCAALKANSSYIVIEDLDCTTLEGGSGGLSIGSLGQFPESYDVVSNVHFRRCHMKNAESAMRIKSWPDKSFAAEFHLHGGGGSGLVSNITWHDITVEDVSVAIEINQCYGVSNKSLCEGETSRVAINGASFVNIKGRTNTKKDPYAGTVSCSHALPCRKLNFHNFNVRAPKGRQNVFACANIDWHSSNMQEIRCASTFIDVRGEGKDKYTIQPPLRRRARARHSVL